MLHVAVTSCPNLVCRVAWSWRTLRAGNPSLFIHLPPLPLPPILPPPCQPLASFWHCLIFPLENKTLTTVFLLKALSQGPWADTESAEVITTSSRSLINWRSLSCLPLINYTWSPLLLSLNSYPEGNTYAAYIFPCWDIYIWYVPVLYM